MEEKEVLADDYMFQHPNLYVLMNASVVFPEFPMYRFIGTTLWTDKAPPIQSLNDFKYIPFTTTDWTTLHANSVAFLEDELEDASQQVVVITHHMPTYAMIAPNYKDSPLNCGFAANCDSLMSHPKICLWVCGHSHGQMSIEHPCRCSLNARGYPNEDSISGYNSSYCVDLATGTTL
jgi:hypothetical protein